MPRDELKVLTLAAKGVQMTPEMFMREATKICLEKMWAANARKASQDSAHAETPSEGNVMEEVPGVPMEVEPDA